MTKNKTTHGGRREGAGRKPIENPKHKVLIYLTAEEEAELRRKAAHVELPLGRYVAEFLIK